MALQVIVFSIGVWDLCTNRIDFGVYLTSVSLIAIVLHIYNLKKLKK